ncbi:MAG: hypothetical protein M3328_05510, partial [Chloroflexota bacterium]|nr:hypothetical protein [Chloroflexota bacterium]
FNTTYVLQSSGDYVLTGRAGRATTGTLDQATVDKIRQQVDAVRSIPDLQLTYDEGNVADDIYRTVTFERDGMPVAVVVAEQGGKDITPASLQQLITTLRDLVEKP